MGPALQSTEIAPETAPSMPSEIPSEITSEIPSERHRLRQEGGTLWLVATEEIAAGQVGLQPYVVEAATVGSGGCNMRLNGLDYISSRAVQIVSRAVQILCRAGDSL